MQRGRTEEGNDDEQKKATRTNREGHEELQKVMRKYRRLRGRTEGYEDEQQKATRTNRRRQRG